MPDSATAPVPDAVAKPPRDPGLQLSSDDVLRELREIRLKRPPALRLSSGKSSIGSERVVELVRYARTTYGDERRFQRQLDQEVAALKRVRPDLLIVLGGPEVSYETDGQEIVRLADYVITGEGDLAFAALCRRLLAGERPAEKVIAAPLPDFPQLALPYDLYTDSDLAHRVLYVEASRGCPFSCEFCLSSLDVPVRQVPLDRLLPALQRLLDRGARQFKFVDRTFNLDLRFSRALLEFFLARWQPGLFLHFEMIPDRLPEPLFTPATKAQSGHDINIREAEAATLVDPSVLARARDLTLRLYAEGANGGVLFVGNVNLNTSGAVDISGNTVKVQSGGVVNIPTGTANIYSNNHDYNLNAPGNATHGSINGPTINQHTGTGGRPSF